MSVVQKACADCGTTWGELNYSSITGQVYCLKHHMVRQHTGVGYTETFPSEWAEEPDDEGVVVPISPKAREYHHNISPDRYAGRRVDVREMLSRPPQPIPWRVHDVVADGTLTIISGESGSGKSWLLQAMCSGVAHGRPVAGLLCNKGKALYLDGEMGATMFVDQRIRPTGATTADFELIDAMGLDLSTPHDLKWFKEQIVTTGANFAGVDSLRRLAPSKAENDSDDMAPVVSALAKVARDTNAAIVLVHHKGDGEKFFRGSTAIRDQADALFGLLRDGDDGDVRRLACGGGRGKMRYAPEPPDRFVVISPADGGVAAADRPEPAGSKRPVLDVVKAEIIAALPSKTKSNVAKKIGRERDDTTFQRAWNDLYEAGTITTENSRWVVVVPAGPNGGEYHHNLRLIESSSTARSLEDGGAVA